VSFQAEGGIRKAREFMVRVLKNKHTLKMYRDLSRHGGSRSWSFHQTPGGGKNMFVHNLINLNGLKRSSLNETVNKY